MSEPSVPGIQLAPTMCAICGTFGNAAELYPPTYDAASFNERVFSARRLPDTIHYRLVRCLACGLARSDPAADRATLPATRHGRLRRLRRGGPPRAAPRRPLPGGGEGWCARRGPPGVGWGGGLGGGGGAGAG